jgi:hypothetical protein
MDELSPFKHNGDLHFSFPLTAGFQEILFDFVQATAIKNGFPKEESASIAENIRQKLSPYIQTNEHLPCLEAEITLAHRSDRLAIKTEIRSLDFSDNEIFIK